MSFGRGPPLPIVTVMGPISIVGQRLRSSFASRFGLPPAIRPRLERHAWLAYLSITLAASGIVGALGDVEARGTLFSVWAVTMAAAIALGVGLHQPDRRRGWLLVAGGSILITFTTSNTLQPEIRSRFWLLDVLELVGYAGELVGCAILFRGRIPGGDRAGLLDAAILATGAAVVISALTLVPQIAAAGRAPDETGWLFYLYVSMITAGIAVRTFFTGGRHRPAARLFVFGILAAMFGSALDIVA